MNCKEIENILPLYPDDLLSPAEKRAVEEHLKTCPKCCKELAYLQQTTKMAHDLKEVDPPPWFKQKIMAEVRAAAEQKSFLHKWFYPLRIKIPVQIFATIVITVLAVYIYRAGEEEMKAVLPDAAPVVEAPKEVVLPQAEMQKEKESVFAGQRIKKKVGPGGSGGSAEKGIAYDVSSGAAAPQLKEEEKKTVANKPAAKDSAAVAAKKDAPLDKASESQGAMLSSKQEAPVSASPVVPQKGTESSGASRKSIAYKTAAPQNAMAKTKQQQAVITVHVKDIDGAAQNIEKILGKYEAQNIVRQASAGKTTITAKLQVQNIEELVEQLKTIGKIEMKGVAADNSEQYKTVLIEIQD